MPIVFPARCTRTMKTKTPEGMREWMGGYKGSMSMLICSQKCFGLPGKYSWVLCFMIFIWKMWFPFSQLRVRTLVKLGTEGGARLEFPGNKPNHQDSWPPALKNQNCCLRGVTGLQRLPRKKISKRKQTVSKPKCKVAGGMASLLPMLLRKLRKPAEKPWLAGAE